MRNRLFRDTIETLLSGQVICSVSNPDLYKFMQGEGKIDEVNLYLAKLERGVAQTADSSGIYCVYNEIEDDDVRKIMIRQFKDLAVNWEALLEWLKMSRELSASALSLKQGDILRESELLSAIEESSKLQDDLGRVLEKFKIKITGSRERMARERLTRLLEHLRAQGFFVKLSESVYRCTARWSLLFDQLAYVRVQDGILADKMAEEAGADQEALF